MIHATKKAIPFQALTQIEVFDISKKWNTFNAFLAVRGIVEQIFERFYTHELYMDI